MAEKIYSIKIKEAFDKKCGCPLCALEESLEQEEIKRILGAAMMEPDTRVATNREGFCGAHLEKMFASSNKLSMALMLTTHLQELGGKLFRGDGKRAAGAYKEARESCYLCGRMNHFMRGVNDNICYLYQSDESFPALLREQEYICKTHTARLLAMSEKALPKKERAAFAKDIAAVNEGYIMTLLEDLDWFTKKFDYRYAKEDWKNSKDAIERTVKYLK